MDKKFDPIKKELKRELRQAYKKDEKLYNQLRLIEQGWGKYESALKLSRLLRSEFRDVRYFTSIALRICNEPKVIPALMKAMIDPKNEGYATPYVWACTEYDCTKYIDFFVKFILKSNDANGVTWGALEVIKKMKGPFDKKKLRLYILKFTRAKIPLSSTSKIVHELLFAESGGVIHDVLIDQINSEWSIQNN